MKKLMAILAAVLACHASYAAELYGTVDAFSGSSYVRDVAGRSVAVSLGMKIYEGQTIQSGADGEVHIVTEDGGIIAVRPNTVFRIDEYKADGDDGEDRVFMSLLEGAIRSISGWIGKHNSSAYRVKTPNSTIGIRGTDHEVTVIENGGGEEPGTYAVVYEGATVVSTSQGETEVIPGKYAFTSKRRAGAPIFLERKPRFMEKRRLRVEGRIQKRKEYLYGRLKNMRENRIRKVHEMRGKGKNVSPRAIRERGGDKRKQNQRGGQRHPAD